MSLKKVAIFWDYASCPPADDSASDFRLAIGLRETCGQYGNIALFKVYYGPESNNSRVESGTDGGFALDSAGIVAVHRPEMGVSTLATDELCFWADNLESPSTIVFVTSNPTLLYTAAALESRNAEVGFIVPPKGMYGCYSLLELESTLGPDKKVPSIPQATLQNKPSPNDASTGPIDAADANEPAAIAAQPIKVQTTHMPTRERVAQPLQPVWVVNPIIHQKVVFTTVHTLQMLETEPLYASLIKDPKAMQIKTWHRQLKQMFYRGGGGVSNNPQAPGELEALFSKVEKYDGMTRDYLAFSRIGKLMTQISQMYSQEFDYRRGYIDRAKSLLVQWDKLITNGEV